MKLLHKILGITLLGILFAVPSAFSQSQVCTGGQCYAVMGGSAVLGSGGYLNFDQAAGFGSAEHLTKLAESMRQTADDLSA